MQLEELYENIESHPELEGISMYDVEGDVWVEVQHKASQQMFLIKMSEVIDQPWEKIEPVLTLASSGVNLTCYSRVCGYFSRTENWSTSKLSEREARLKGNYKL